MFNGQSLVANDKTSTQNISLNNIELKLSYYLALVLLSVKCMFRYVILYSNALSPVLFVLPGEKTIAVFLWNRYIRDYVQVLQETI